MKRIFLLVIGIMIFSLPVLSQENKIYTQEVLRINFINPGVEYEFPVFKKSTVAFNLGLGYGDSYPKLTYYYENGWLYMIAPFLDVHYKAYYNIDKRASKQKRVDYNSANFFGVRTLMRGKSLTSNFNRTTNYDFAVGPTWGIQRSYGKINLLFDVGVNYYFDTKGNSGVAPVLELNIGYNINHKKK